MTDPTEARDASQNADEKLKKQRSRWPDVESMVASLRKIREENHFSELITEAMGSHK